MAEFLVKIADERGNLAQQVEHGYSETEVRDRFAQQGYLVYWVKPRTVLSGGALRGRKVRQSQFVIFNQHGNVLSFRQNQDLIVTAIQNALGGPAPFTYQPVTLALRLAHSDYEAAKARGETEPPNER